MAFLPRDPEDAKEARRLVEQALVAERLELLRWRLVPVDHGALGEVARANAPAIEQAVFRVAGRGSGGLKPSPPEVGGPMPRTPSGAASGPRGGPPRPPGPPGSACTSPPARPGRSPTRRCARPTSSPPSIPTWPTPPSRSPSPCSTSATPPTPRPPGSAPSRSASSATTARSTPSTATWPGCGPGRGTWGPASWTRTCCGRCSTPTAPTPASSTTRWSCWSGAGATSATPWPCWSRRSSPCPETTARTCATSTATTPA